MTINNSSAAADFIRAAIVEDLKSNRFGIIYQRLPSLDLLATMSRRAAVLGLLFLTITICIGYSTASIPASVRAPARGAPSSSIARCS